MKRGQAQRGFALVISLILLLILSFVGINMAQQGIIAAQLARTSSRYAVVKAITEGELRRIAMLFRGGATISSSISHTQSLTDGKVVTTANLQPLVQYHSDGTTVRQYLLRVTASAYNTDDSKRRETVTISHIYQSTQ